MILYLHNIRVVLYKINFGGTTMTDEISRSIELLKQALYAPQNSMPTFLENYFMLLRETGDTKLIQQASKIHEYMEVLHQKKDSFIPQLFEGFCTVLEEKFPSLGFRIAGRRKSFISYMDKILRKQANKESLDAIRDIVGVRIILFTDNNQDCYKVMELIIDYCIYNECFVCEKKNDGNNHLSEISKHLADFHYGIRDYIQHPKSNNYQSLHVVFRHIDGLCFEVQIRTIEMHTAASLGSADHETYKDNAILNDKKLDLSQINMKGFNLTQRGSMDLIGIIYSVEILQRNNSYPAMSLPKDFLNHLEK